MGQKLINTHFLVFPVVIKDDEGLLYIIKGRLLVPALRRSRR